MSAARPTLSASRTARFRRPTSLLTTVVAKSCSQNDQNSRMLLNYSSLTTTPHMQIHLNQGHTNNRVKIILKNVSTLVDAWQSSTAVTANLLNGFVVQTRTFETGWLEYTPCIMKIRDPQRKFNEWCFFFHSSFPKQKLH